MIFTAIAAVVFIFGKIGISPLMAQTGQSVLKVEAGTQPTATVAPPNAKAVPFTVIELTAVGSRDIRINGLTIENKSVASDGVFSEVGVSGAPIYLEEFALNADHRRTTKKSFIVKAGTTMEITLYGNMASDLSSYGGQAPALSLVAIDADAPIEGSLPVAGTTHTTNNNLTIGTVGLTRGALDPNSNQEFVLNTKDAVLTSARVDAGSQEGIVLQFVTWTDYGTIALSDLANVRTVIIANGTTTSYETASDPYYLGGKQWTADLGSGIFIPKGGSAEIALRADIASGANHTIEFDLETGFIQAAGQTYGYTLQNSATVVGSIHTITTGAMNASPANQTQYRGEPQLGEVTLDVKGEPMEIRSFELQLSQAGITGVKLWDSAGMLVAGPANPSSSGKVTWTSTWIAPVGKTIYHVTGSSSGNFEKTPAITAKGIHSKKDVTTFDTAGK